MNMRPNIETGAVLIGLCILLVLFGMFWMVTENSQELDISTAKPIYQQRIGDEADPDILIIYEAEVDGVKVYPSVIKEAE